MGEKRINFRKIIKGIKRQGIRMQQRLIVYWCVVILTLFLATVLLLSIIGVLPGMDFKVREMLSAQQWQDEDGQIHACQSGDQSSWQDSR